MCFDLTREIVLDKKNRKLYQILQALLYLATVLVASYLAFIILFPSFFFTFNFGIASTQKNTIIDPRTEPQTPLDHGVMPAGKNSYFDTALTGIFSKAVVNFVLNKKSPNLSANTQIIIKKSYAAFLYPTEKNTDLLKNYLTTAKLTRFSDGSLVSYGDSIYLLSGTQSFPIDSPVTFLSKGYSWDDVVPASADEIAMYKKGKLFTIASPHPDGTIFKTIEDGKYYLVENKTKYLLPSEEIAKSLLANHSPILVSENSLDETASCQFKKDFSFSKSYSCEIPIDALQQLIGSDYEFSLEPSEAIRIDAINVEFKKDISQKNFRTTLSEIFNLAKNNYVQTNPTP
jgi:hypothetical protein